MAAIDKQENLPKEPPKVSQVRVNNSIKNDKTDDPTNFLVISQQEAKNKFIVNDSDDGDAL